jgi:hypothetical protein
MADRTPIWFDVAGDSRAHPYGTSDTLKWNFTNTGVADPVAVQLGGVDSFVFYRSGAIRTAQGYQALTDGVGAVGLQYTFRPANVFAAGQVAVGAILGTGDGARLRLNSLTLGHAAVDKYLYADQAGASTPCLRYQAVAAKWQYSHDGVSFATMQWAGGLEVLEFRQIITLSIASPTTNVGLTPGGPVLEAAIRVATQVTGLPVADQHVQLGIAGVAAKYCDASQGAPSANIDVNKKAYYAGVPLYEAAALLLSIASGATPTGGTVEVLVRYYAQANLPDV